MIIYIYEDDPLPSAEDLENCEGVCFVKRMTREELEALQNREIR